MFYTEKFEISFQKKSRVTLKGNWQTKKKHWPKKRKNKSINVLHRKYSYKYSNSTRAKTINISQKKYR